MMRVVSWSGIAIATLLAVAAAAGCGRGDEPPEHADLARVAERLRLARPELEASCDGGYHTFAATAGRALQDVPGGERFARAAVAAGARQGPVAPTALEEPALERLVLLRYATLCACRAADVAADRLDALAGARVDAERLGEAIEDLAPQGVAVSAAAACSEGVVEATLPSPDGDDAPIDLLACARCRPGGGATGGAQVATALAAMGLLAEARIAPSRPVRLRVCPDRRGGQPCGGCLARGASDETLALDGGSPLVLARFAEVRWELTLPHRAPTEAVLAAAAARARLEARRTPRPARPIVLDAATDPPRSAGRMPASSWMRLWDPGSATPEALAGRARERVAALEPARPGARYSVEVSPEDGTVLVRAEVEGRAAHRVAEGRSSLGDLAALAVALDVGDPPGGALSDLLRSVARLDGDVGGRRLGLYYEAPGIGGLLLAATGLRVESSVAVLALTIYRPPGLDERAFGARLADARMRLSSVAGHMLDEGSRSGAAATGVGADAPLARTVQTSFETVVGDRPTPDAETHPGLSSSVTGAVTVGLPVASEEGGPTVRPEAVALVVDLLWQLAVAADPAVADASTLR